jgi:hypothetical protein
MSSLTTLAGRSTTSPAAIWFCSSGGRILILLGDIFLKYEVGRMKDEICKVDEENVKKKINFK